MGKFQPGQSGNPGGRPKEYPEIKALARQHTAEAVETLVLAMRNPQTAVPASIALLDRGWGKPPQAHTGEDGEGPIKTILEVTWKSSGGESK